MLVLDEVQRVPQWSTPVKGLWDRDRMEGRQLHVVVLGSAPLLMQSGLSESLVGRTEPLPVPHWSLTEMAAAFGFGLDEYLFFGGYPGTADLIQDLSGWRRTVADFITRTVERDVASMSRVDRPALLRNLFDAAAAYSAQPVTLRTLLGELDSRENAGTHRALPRPSGIGRTHRRPSQTHRGEPVIRRSPPKLVVLNTALMTAPAIRTFEGAQAQTAAIGGGSWNRRSGRISTRRALPASISDTGATTPAKWTSCCAQRDGSWGSRSNPEGRAAGISDWKPSGRGFRGRGRCLSGRVAWRSPISFPSPPRTGWSTMIVDLDRLVRRLESNGEWSAPAPLSTYRYAPA